jgi:hypothetical protein
MQRGNHSQKKRLHPKPLGSKSLSNLPLKKFLKKKTKQNKTKAPKKTKTILKKRTFMPLQELASDGRPDCCKSTTTKPLICFPTFQTPLFLFFINFFT